MPVSVESVSVSSVREEVCDDVGEMLEPRPICDIDGVANDLGMVEEEDGRRAEPNLPFWPPADPIVRAPDFEPPTGISSSDVGGTPLYNSA